MSGTTDQAIDDALGALIADLQDDTGLNHETSTAIKAVYDRLVIIRTQARNGRGDDWIGLVDPIEQLALAGYRADAILNKNFTPPNWDFIDEGIKESWRAWAKSTVKEL